MGDWGRSMGMVIAWIKRTHPDWPFFSDNFELILEGCKFAYENGYRLWEQDILNYLFSKKYQKLPNKFNLVMNWERKYGERPFKLEKAMYHFAGGDGAKPSFDTDDIYNKLYFEYFLKTPWATADMFGNLHKAADKEFRSAYNESRNILLHFTNLLTERKRAFFIDKNYLEFAKNVFKIKDDERVLTMQEGVAKFLEEITATKGEKIFFVLSIPYNYFQVRNFLLSKGFVEGVDFINATIFLSERYGVPFDFNRISRELVQEL